METIAFRFIGTCNHNIFAMTMLTAMLDEILCVQCARMTCSSGRRGTLEFVPIIVLLVSVLISSPLTAQKKIAPKPLYDDPVYHGAADPVIIYNRQKKKWWMFYTNRRASIDDSTVRWVHGTRIGIA